MGDKDNSVTMEPLLSPTKSGKAKVKAARFQVNLERLKVRVDSLKCRWQVWVQMQERGKLQEVAMMRMGGLIRVVRGDLIP